MKQYFINLGNRTDDYLIELNSRTAAEAISDAVALLSGLAADERAALDYCAVMYGDIDLYESGDCDDITVLYDSESDENEMVNTLMHWS